MARHIKKHSFTQTFSEELANSISHGVAALGSASIIPILIIGAVSTGGAANVIGASIFGITMLMLYLTSTLYHALPRGKAKQIFQVIDHCAIFLLIAGTYTPFTLGVLRGSVGWTLFGVVWGLTLVGILHKIIFGIRYPAFSTCLYIAMGWLVLFTMDSVMNSIPLQGLLWLLAGGIAYTVGVIFFIIDRRVRFAHFIWHLFVIVGSFCHFIAVYRYAG